MQSPGVIRGPAPVWNRMPESEAGQHTKTYTGKESRAAAVCLDVLWGLDVHSSLAKGQPLCAAGRKPGPHCSPPGAHRPIPRRSSLCSQGQPSCCHVPLAQAFCRTPLCRGTSLGTVYNRVNAADKEPSCQRRKLKRQQGNPWFRKTPLEEDMATHSSALAWITSGTEEPGGL